MCKLEWNGKSSSLMKSIKKAVFVKILLYQNQLYLLPLLEWYLISFVLLFSDFS